MRMGKYQRERIAGEERDAILAIRDGTLLSPAELSDKLYAEALDKIKRTAAPDPEDTERWARTKPREETA